MKFSSSLSLRQLLQMAVKAEVESRDIYKKLADQVDNYLLSEKLNFLATEEEMHRQTFIRLFKNHFESEELTLSEETLVPVPELKPDEDMLITTVLKKAMEAELSMAQHFQDYNRFDELIHFGP